MLFGNNRVPRFRAGAQAFLSCHVGSLLCPIHGDHPHPFPARLLFLGQVKLLRNVSHTPNKAILLNNQEFLTNKDSNLNGAGQNQGAKPFLSYIQPQLPLFLPHQNPTISTTGNKMLPLLIYGSASTKEKKDKKKACCLKSSFYSFT